MDEKKRKADSGDLSPSKDEGDDILSIDDKEFDDLSAAENTGPHTPADRSAELEGAKKDYLYLLAEFDNYKKHAIKERSDLLKYGTERIVRELLEVIDNFERALTVDVAEAGTDSFREGIKLIHKELITLLNRFGVTEVASLGETFDPGVHEALSSEETSAYPPGHISRVFRKAYKLHDRLIRPAQVVVAKEPTANKD